MVVEEEWRRVVAGGSCAGVNAGRRARRGLVVLVDGEVDEARAMLCVFFRGTKSYFFFACEVFCVCARGGAQAHTQPAAPSEGVARGLKRKEE